MGKLFIIFIVILAIRMIPVLFEALYYSVCHKIIAKIKGYKQ